MKNHVLAPEEVAKFDEYRLKSYFNRTVIYDRKASENKRYSIEFNSKSIQGKDVKHLYDTFKGAVRAFRKAMKSHQNPGS